MRRSRVGLRIGGLAVQARRVARYGEASADIRLPGPSDGQIVGAVRQIGGDLGINLLGRDVHQRQNPIRHGYYDISQRLREGVLWSNDETSGQTFAINGDNARVRQNRRPYRRPRSDARWSDIWNPVEHRDNAPGPSDDKLSNVINAGQVSTPAAEAEARTGCCHPVNWLPDGKKRSDDDGLS